MKVIHHEIGNFPPFDIWVCLGECMIIYMHSEGGSIVFQDMIYPIKKGTLCFIKAGKRHYTLQDDPVHYDRSKMFASEEMIQEILSSIPEKNDFYYLFTHHPVIYAEIPPEKQEEVEMIFQEVDESIQSDKSCSEVYVCNWFRLMVYLKQYVIQQEYVPEDVISKAVEYINYNYSQPLSLDDICKEIHISKHYFCRKFKQTMGMTVMEYILKTRIAAAKNFLLLGEGSIGEISDRCGFSSISYFCQIFKQNTGMTAHQYRKNRLKQS